MSEQIVQYKLNSEKESYTECVNEDKALNLWILNREKEIYTICNRAVNLWLTRDEPCVQFKLDGKEKIYTVYVSKNRAWNFSTISNALRRASEIEFVTLRCKFAPRLVNQYAIRKIKYCKFEWTESIGNLCVNCPNLREVYFEGGDDVINMSHSFCNCPKLEKVKMNGFNKLETLCEVFFGCPNVKEVWFGYVPKLNFIYEIFKSHKIPCLLVFNDDSSNSWDKMFEYVKYMESGKFMAQYGVEYAMSSCKHIHYNGHDRYVISNVEYTVSNMIAMKHVICIIMRMIYCQLRKTGLIDGSHDVG